jgi:hypothetical protein
MKAEEGAPLQSGKCHKLYGCEWLADWFVQEVHDSTKG